MQFELEELEKRITPDVNPYLVTTPADDPNIKIQGQTTLRDAIAAADASNYETITFASTVNGNNIQLQKELPHISKDMTISADPGQNIGVLGGGSAQNPFRVFTIDTGVLCSIDGLGISNGFVNGDGGDIYNAGSLMLNNDTVTGGQTSGSVTYGGGIYNATKCYLTLVNTNVSSNNLNGETYEGGGIYNGGVLTVSAGSTFNANYADFGAGLFNAPFATSKLKGNTVITENFATQGGGIYNSSGFITMTGGKIADNRATDGVGLYVLGGSVTLSGGVNISNNQSGEGEGGGMFIGAGTVKMTGGTIAGNTGAVFGGGIFNLAGSLTLSGALTIGPGNSVSGYGGGLYLGKNSKTTFNDVNISGNQADAGGVGFAYEQGAFLNVMKINNPDGSIQLK